MRLSEISIRQNIERFGNHQATFPEKLIEPLILTTSKPGDIVLDPFSGLGTVAVVSKKTARNYIGIELSKKYCELSRQRIREACQSDKAA